MSICSVYRKLCSVHVSISHPNQHENMFFVYTLLSYCLLKEVHSQWRNTILLLPQSFEKLVAHATLLMKMKNRSHHFWGKITMWKLRRYLIESKNKISQCFFQFLFKFSSIFLSFFPILFQIIVLCRLPIDNSCKFTELFRTPKKWKIGNSASVVLLFMKQT